tara:strand:+ start:4176 stop:4652 length:477 start_codon:yes stop_codon:yes gene_type:complete
MNSKAIEKLREAVGQVYRAGLNLGDPMIMYNERYLEYLMADKLGHTKDEHTQGADAYNDKGLPVEYKTFNLDSKSNNRCWQWHWNKEKKLKKLKEINQIFCGTRRGEEIIDIYEMPVQVAIDLAEERILNESKTGVFDKSGFSFTVEKLLEAGGRKVV